VTRDLPAEHEREPRLTKVRVGDRDEQRGMKDRLDFDLVRPASSMDGKAESAVNVVDTKLMRELFEALRRRELAECQSNVREIEEVMQFATDPEVMEQQQAEIERVKDRARQVVNAAYDARKFKPRIVPIELSKSHWRDHLSINLGRWRRSGPDCEAKGFRVMRPSEVQRPDVQEALRMQNLPTAPSDDDLEERPQYWVGNCTQHEYVQVKVKDKTMLRKGRSVATVCMPLLCPHYQPADPKKHPPCKPNVVFTFRLPWTAERGYAWFSSGSWHTASELKATLRNVWKNCGETLEGVRLLFVTYPKRINTPAGKQLKPICYVAPDGMTFEQLRRQAAGLGPAAVEEAQALPTAERVKALPSYVRSFVEDHVDEAPGDLPSWESDFYERATKAGMSDAWIEQTLGSVEDPDAADDILEAAKRNGTSKQEKTEAVVGNGEQGTLL